MPHQEAVISLAVMETLVELTSLQLQLGIPGGLQRLK
jgi:hypothetical protein